MRTGVLRGVWGVGGARDRVGSRNPDLRLTAILRSFSRFSATVLGLAGTGVLLGWVFNQEILKRIFPGLVAMNPLSAVCFIAAGLSLRYFWLAQRADHRRNSRLSQIFSLICVAAGFLKLLNYLAGWDFGIDQLIFSQKMRADQTLAPNRMAPNTAAAFFLSGIPLFLLNSSSRRSAWWVQNLSLLVFFHSLLALLGYAYGSSYLYGVGSFIPMAIHTAALLLLLSVATLFARTDSDVIALFVSLSPGGAIARRLFPFAVLVPALLGALRLWGERAQVYGSEFGVTILVVASIAAFSALIWWNAVLLNRTDSLRREAERQLREAHNELECHVEQRTSELVGANESLRAEIAERQKAEQRILEQANEKKKLEEQFLRAQRMESLGALAGGIAHDLNNALVPVLMGARMLKENAASDEERAQLLELISASGQRCTQMVKQIVNFAKGSRGQRQVLPLRNLIFEMAKVAKDTFPKAILVSADAPANLWNIDADSTELQQILMNLCVNARDAMLAGGRLTIDGANVTLPAEALAGQPNAAPGNYVRLRVADTGTGIPAQALAHLFEPFFTTKAPDKGTGLGLSTVATLVSRYRGFIEVHTEPGEGTEFLVFLPAAPGTEVEDAQRQSVPLSAGSGELVLVVEDEQVVLELARSTLENYGYKVLTAPNGVEAVATFQAHKDDIKVLLTDTDMPFQDGFNAIKAIQAVNSAIPIVLASGAVNEPDRFAGISTDHLVFVSKPYGVEELLGGIAAALKQRQPPVGSQ